MTGLFRQTFKQLLPKSLLTRRLGGEYKKSVLLTFDDGPRSDVTPAVLDLLEKYEARAVFFMPGCRIARAPHLLPDIFASGHEVGNHTYLHSNGKQPHFLAYRKDIEKCQNTIEKLCGCRPRLFRPPCGIISPTTLLAPKLCGLKTVTWSVDVQDWQCRTSRAALEAAKKLIEIISPGDIVLLHDDNPHVIEILQILLPQLKERGHDLSHALEGLN